VIASILCAYHVTVYSEDVDAVGVITAEILYGVTFGAIVGDYRATIALALEI
jgi:hypothetical protein